MASAVVIKTAAKEWPLANPWPWMIVGLAAAGSAAVWAILLKEALTPLRVSLVFAGVLAAGIAVILKPSSVVVLACAAVAAAQGAFGLYLPSDKLQWDSIRLVLAVAALIALLAALVVALPRMWRRIVVSVLIVLHFGGILSAVMSANPGSWVAGVAYVYFYRPYLEFFYLTNAYHFYAPEPGPAYLLWFRIEYTKGDGKTTYWHWHKVPDIDDKGWPQYPLALQYQRRLAASALLAQATQITDPARQLEVDRLHENTNLDRYRSGQLILPRHPNTQLVPRYAEPTVLTSRALSSYVRHVAHDFQNEHPQARIKGIKVYRIVHAILSAGEIAQGYDPQDVTSYHPYFWGEYNSQGVLLDKDDPYLYWNMPFLRVDPDQSPYFKPNREIIPLRRLRAKQDPMALKFFPRIPVEEEDQFSIKVGEAVTGDQRHYKVLGYMYLHAGDTKWVLHSDTNLWKED